MASHRRIHASATSFSGRKRRGTMAAYATRVRTWAGPQFATMTPWVISTHSQYRPGDPPALTSARYATDFNETKLIGNISSTVRTSDQTIYSWFWAQSTASYLWNHAADVLLERRARGDDDEQEGRFDEHRR